MTLTTLPADNFNHLLRHFHHSVDTTGLTKLLRDHNAIIAGGSVLGSLSENSYIRDLDIYVNLKNAQNFYNALFKYQPEIYAYGYGNHTAPPYDSSFLIQNNILGRYNIYLFGTIQTDIMIVSDDVSVESVVENFDLSFCKVWYNGTEIFTNHYQDILERRGTLGQNYLEAYLKGNTFTMKRIKKYTRRGYTITLPNIDTSGMVIKRHHKEVISPETWVVYKLLEILFPMGMNSYTAKLHFSYMIFCLQKLGQYNSEHRQSSIYTMAGFKYLMNILYGSQTTDFWTIDMLIYVMLCFRLEESLESNPERLIQSDILYPSYICTWLQPKYSEYFESIGLQLQRKNGTEAHGFNDLDIPLCDGQVPPFSAGKNDFPEDATEEDLVNRVKEGLSILKMSEDRQKEIYYTTYPHLKPLSHSERVAQHQAQVQAAVRRFAEESSDDDEEEEEATEPYDLPGGTVQVPGRCFSIMDAGDINTSSWYPEEGNILFLVEFYPGSEPDLVCTNTQVLQNAMDNESGINYRCGSRRGFIAGTQTEVNLDGDLPDGVGIDVTMTDIDYSVEYIPFSYGIDGTTSMNGYLPRDQVERMMTVVETGSNVRLFTLEFSDTIPHTVSKNNTTRGREQENFISTNHCQAGSTIMVFRVKEFILAQERSPPAIQRPGRNGQRLTRAVRTLWPGDDSPDSPVAP